MGMGQTLIQEDSRRLKGWPLNKLWQCGEPQAPKKPASYPSATAGTMRRVHYAFKSPQKCVISNLF